MRFNANLKRLLALLALPLALLSTSCAGGGPRVNSTVGRPSEERVRPVDPPAIPPATTPCADDPARMCNSDAEGAGVIAGYDGALAEANRRLCWLRAYLGFSRCPTG